MLQLLHTPIIILHVLVCLVLMLVVLIQPGKSGGLGAALGGAGAQQIFGGRGAGNFLSRTTWIAMGVFFLTSITLAYISTSTGDSLQNVARRKAADISGPTGKNDKLVGEVPPPVGGSAGSTGTTGSSTTGSNSAGANTEKPPAEGTPAPSGSSAPAPAKP
jgi:preprotein translocase subunit SecG